MGDENVAEGNSTQQGRESEASPLKAEKASVDEGGPEPEDRGPGLSFRQALLLVGGLSFGFGIVAVPDVLKQTGWTAGVLVITFGALAMGYSSYLLGGCWMILQERYPEARVETRRPYPLIVEKAFGKRMANFTAANIFLVSFGASVVSILLIAQNCQSLSERAGLPLSQCYWLLIAFAFLTPLTWLDGPKEYWIYGVFGLLSTAVTSVCVILALCFEIADGKKGKPQTNPSAKGLFLSFGNLIFNYGTDFLPNIQHDMRFPAEFEPVVVLSYIGGWALYMILGCFAYYTYGRDMESNILESLPNEWPSVVGNVTISVFCMFLYVSCLNPLTQVIEASLGYGKEFTLKKCILRSSLSVLVLFVSETVPRFGPIMDVIGAAPMLYLCLGPALFYLRLSSQKGEWPDRSPPLHTRVLCIEITCVGLFVAVVSTYSALSELVNSDSETFVPPCYVSLGS